eukprot:GILI01025030.1.p1 GENE.GILI01025030.1~~GILI01025030.1.p1  ORF type:complete len:534 (+),score=85.22 GILI01025030.1:34-1635(+)
MLHRSLSALIIIVIAAVASASRTVVGSFQFTQPSLVANLSRVDFDWTGSQWANRDDAIASGAFVVANNIITGINHHLNQTFICVPRWRVGVPGTLNELVWAVDDDGDKRQILRPWPDWDSQYSTLSYVQSIFIDHVAGEMWVIDTGRRYFFSPNRTINANAELHIYNIANKSIVKNYTFPDAIFSTTTSFLNDIVVDTVRQVAYMSDTNIAGNGAIVAYRRADDAAVRFQDPSSTFANTSFIVEVNGTAYPSITNPVDGIALSSDAARLFYSAVDGNTVYTLNTSYLRTALDNAAAFVPSTLFDKVQAAFFRNTASDGLMYLPTAGYGQVAFGVFNPSSELGVDTFSDSNFYGSLGEKVNRSVVSPAAPWVDTMAVVPWTSLDAICGCGADEVCNSGNVPAQLGHPTSNCLPDDNCPTLLPATLYGFSLFFTANNLQLYFAGTMDFYSDPNMFVYRVDYYYSVTPAKPVRPATEMKLALTFLGVIAFLSFVIIVILIVARISRTQEQNADPGDIDLNYRRYSESRKSFSGRRN